MILLVFEEYIDRTEGDKEVRRSRSLIPKEI
jgi:hypothetical protein